MGLNPELGDGVPLRLMREDEIDAVARQPSGVPLARLSLMGRPRG